MCVNQGAEQKSKDTETKQEACERRGLNNDDEK